MIADRQSKPKQTAVLRTFPFPQATLLAAFLLLPGFGAGAQTSGSVTLAWNASYSPGIAGYNLYWGGASQSYTNELRAGNQTNAIVTGLAAGVTYFFAVTACATNGLESPFSAEISYTPPVPVSNPPPVIALTAPATGASYTAPANINLAASVILNGHTIVKVQFFSGSTLLGEATAAPYAFSWTNVGAGAYALSAVAVYDTGSTVASLSANVTVTTPPAPPAPTLPAPWQALDIGNVGLTGSASVANGRYTVAGAGNLSANADNFQFLYQPLTGDGQITARFLSAQSTNLNARTGVMIRETLTPGSEYAFMGISPESAFRVQRRSRTSAKTISSTSGSGALPNVWARLIRTNNTFYAYKSTTGTNWTLVNSSTINMAPNIYIGLMAASGATNALNTATFTNVTVVP